jgi:hypothetical protein
MLIVGIAWLYVALMMALAEALHPDGHLLGAVMTFLLYGLGPVALVLYLMGTPLRRKARAAAEAAAESGGVGTVEQTDGSGHAPGDTVTPERKEV